MCPHKFIYDLQLDYVEWEVNTLFIGTFNPGCCANEDIEADWFYGRTQNNMFWDTLGYIYENNPLLGQQGNPELWIAFCRKHKLAVTDLISKINDVDLNGKPYLSIQSFQYSSDNTGFRLTFRYLEGLGYYSVKDSLRFDYGWPSSIGNCGNSSADPNVFTKGGGLISNINLVNRTVSGIFAFKVKNSVCDTIFITDGRFDIKF